MLNFLRNKKIKLIKVLILTLIFIAPSQIKALTIEDIELLISTGIIPLQNATSARNFLNKKDVATTNNQSVSVSNPNSTTSCLIINQNLVQNMSGTLVGALQSFLKRGGYFPAGESITNSFGPTTKQAVVDFQLATGLIKTSTQEGAGNVGPLTRAKIQELSCLSVTEQNIAAQASSTNPQSTTTAKFINAIRNSATPQNTIVTEKPIRIISDAYERYRNKDTGEVHVRYSIRTIPKDILKSLSVIVLCDPSGIEMRSNFIKKCGEFYEVDEIKNGKKSFIVKYKNVSSAFQNIIFASELFNELKQIIGTEEMVTKIDPANSVIKVNINGNESNRVVAPSLRSRNCNVQEQLEFIRYTMTPFNPTTPVSLPVCWPGDLRCNRSNPPTFCEIIDGPSSDDLCLDNQVFINGRCELRESS